MFADVPSATMRPSRIARASRVENCCVDGEDLAVDEDRVRCLRGGGRRGKDGATTQICAIANGLIVCSFDGHGRPEGLHYFCRSGRSVTGCADRNRQCDVVRPAITIDHARAVLKETARIGRRTVGRVQRLPPQPEVDGELAAVMRRMREPPRQHPGTRARNVEKRRLPRVPIVGLAREDFEPLGRAGRVVIDEGRDAFPRRATRGG